MHAILKIKNMINRLSLRERILVFLGMLFMLYITWNFFWMQPLSDATEKAQANIEKKQKMHTKLNAKLQQLTLQKKHDPDAQNKQRQIQFNEQIKKTEKQIQKFIAGQVAPEKIVEALENVLFNTKDLKLIKVEGLGATELNTKKEKKKNENNKAQIDHLDDSSSENLYKHGLRVTFEGDYMGTLDYIRKIEELEWGFIWDSVEFEAKEYPNALAVITISTLSTEKGWIGI